MSTTDRLLAHFVFSLVLLIVAIAATAAESTRPPPADLTARDAVIYALQNSPDSRIAAQRIIAAAAAREEANSAFRPRLNLNAGYSQTNNPMFSFGNILNQGSFDNTIDFNDPGRTDNLAVQAELLYNLYSGGRDSARQYGAESAYLAREHDRRLTENQLGFEVMRAFQEIAQAEKQVDVRRAEEAAIEASLQVARARFEAGDLLKTEVLNFEVQKARASENLIISTHQLELAKKVLLNLLGLESTTVTIDREAAIVQSAPNPSEYRKRPEIAALEARLEAAASDLEAAQAANRPSIDGFATYQYDYGFVLDDGGDSWSAGLKLSYNLYDGHQASARIAAKQAAYDELKERLAKLQLAVNLDIQQTELTYRQAVERLDVTEKLVEVAHESARLSRDRFKEGLILSSDLIDTELRLTDALLRQAVAQAQHLTAIADVRRAGGYQQFAPTTEELLENQP